MDGPVGDLMRRTELSHFRPAHVHFLIDEQGYRKLITHPFQAGSDYLDSDVVFGTKNVLIIPFTEQPAGTAAPDGGTLEVPYLHAEFDFVLESR